MNMKKYLKKSVKMATVFFSLLIYVSFMTALKAQTYPEQPTSGPGIDQNAMLLIDFEDPAQRTGWTTNYLNAAIGPTWEIMDAENGDPVRFGRYALKMNWDFSTSSTGTLAQLINPPGNAYKIPGSFFTSGLKIGMWIYCSPECYGNLWFRFQQVSPGNTAAGSGTNVYQWGNEPNHSSNGVWNLLQPAGTWQYHEFTVDGSDAGTCAAHVGKEIGPFAAATASWGMFRIIQVTGSAAQPNSKGYIIIDNIRAINSTGVEDRTPPTISTLTGNGTTIAATGTVFDTSLIDFAMTYTDGTGTNDSGINPASVKFIVNGIPYGAGVAGFSADGTTATFTGVRVPSGTNTVVAHIEDMFGFITTSSYTFTVEGGTSVDMVFPAQAEVGNVFEMKINTNDLQDIKALSIEMDMNSVGSVAATGGVEFAASASASTYSFNATTGRLTINLANDVASAQEGEGTMATIKVDVSKTCLYTDVLRITPVSANVTYADDSSTPFALFSGEIARPAKETYNFTVLKRAIGLTGEVLVTDLGGNPVSDATVYALNAAMTSEIAHGITDASGVASFNFATSTTAINIYAEKDGKCSFTRSITPLMSQLSSTPSAIRSGTTADPSTSKTIVWMSNPATADAAYIKIAKKSEGETAFVQHEGETRILEFEAPASSGTVRGSKVTVTGLTPETEYIYQVGDGTNWSGTREFTTTSNTDKFSFSAFGDLQASGTGDMGMFLAAAQTVQEKETTPYFSLNVGDIVDRDNRWDYNTTWNYLFDQRPSFGDIDMVSTYGNHEYDGYAGNMLFLNGHPAPEPQTSANMDIVGEGTYYAVYGNMLVIGLDWEVKDSFIAGSAYTASQRIAEQAKWMDDVLESHKDKTWKIVTLHYPIFPEQSSPGLQSVYGSLFDKHNVQLVFCGHGHTFERYQAKGGVTTTTSGDRKTLKPAIDKGTLYWQIGGMASNTGTDSRRWIFADVDGGKIYFTVRDANNNTISTNECFTLYAAPEYIVPSHAVTFSVTGGNGTLTATVDGRTIFSGSNEEVGKNLVFTATPNTGYTVKEWKVNGNVEIGNKTNTLAYANLTAALAVTVEFEELPHEPVPVTFNVTGDNGELEARVDNVKIESGSSVEYGKNVVFTAIPESNYRVKEWKLNGTVVSGNTTNSYTLTNVTSTATVTVEFDEMPPNFYTVKFSVTGSNGTLAASVDGTSIATGDAVQQDKDVVFTATPDASFQVKEWRLNGAIVNGKNATYTMTVSANAELTVEFEVATYPVTFSTADGNGVVIVTVDSRTISSGAQIVHGKDIVFTATPNEGFQVKEWKLNGFVVTDNKTNVYTHNNISEAIEVSVAFESSIASDSRDLSVNQLKAWILNGLLYVNGLKPGVVWSVYNAAGALVYQNVATGEEAKIPLGNQGVYIIQSENYSVKVVY